MNDATNGITPAARYRIEAGHDVLDAWAETANRNRKNAVYEALFDLLDGSLFRHYRVIEDLRRLDEVGEVNEVIVIVRDNLTLRIRLYRSDSFGIVDIEDRAVAE